MRLREEVEIDIKGEQYKYSDRRVDH